MVCESYDKYLVDYVFGETDPAQSAEIEEHLSSCRACADEVRGIRETVRILREADERVNRPAPGLRIDAIIEGLIAFRKEFAGELRLEILLVDSINDTQAELEAIRAAALRIAPDSIDLNTVARPPAEEFVAPLTPERLAEAVSFLGQGAAAVAPSTGAHHGVPGEAAEKILDLLRRRPCSFAEICSSLGIETAQAAMALSALSRKGFVEKLDDQQDGFYGAR